MKKIYLEVVVFICGAVVMAYEIIGSRILGPYVGTSMFVWTAIIGIILFSLSLGYYLGGKQADRKPQFSWLSVIIAMSGVFILLSLFFRESVLNFLLNSVNSIQVVSVLASLILFSIPAFFLGMVSPYAARLKIKTIATSGATVGYLYALSTLGSITGTFLAGFFLIPGFRLTTILLILSVTLIIFAVGLYFIYRSTEPKKISNIR